MTNFNDNSKPEPDLKGDAFGELAEAVNPIIADGFALYEKTKYFYLNSLLIDDYRTMLDEHAAEIFATIDALVQRLRDTGVPTVSSTSHTGELERVEDYDDFPKPDQMIEELINDNQRLETSLLAAAQICENLPLAPIGIVLQDILEKTRRRVGMLGELEIEVG